jgi:hypothetical protein
MAAPLSRLGQITQAEVLINDNTNQDISALDVRNTLTGIIDSNTGMKTIWVGTIKSTFALTITSVIGTGKRFIAATRTGVRVIETYSDPYFFPPTPAKYLITNAGSGIQGSATQKNIPTSLVLPASDTDYRFGGGLTFDCTVNTTSLTLSSINVANPGSGYSSLLLASSDPGWGIVELNFPLVTVKPVVKIQLSTVVAAANGDTNTGDISADLKKAVFSNAFCFTSPTIGTALYPPPGDDYTLYAVQVFASNNSFVTNTGEIYPFGSAAGAYTSTIGQYTNANNSIGGFNTNFYNIFDADSYPVGTQNLTTTINVEIKVPIINTTF